MFLDDWPSVARWGLLGISGAVVGALVNLAIYQLGYFRRRPISPWSSPPTEVGRRPRLAYVPIVGWLALRREANVHGRGFWIRPLAIEAFCAAGLIGLYEWYSCGGLVGRPLADIAQPDAITLGTWHNIWFLAHAMLFSLLLVATFIDFDEQTIPDWVTITGTLAALAIAILAPSVRLPAVTSELAGWRVVPVDWTSPRPHGQWFAGPWGLATALGIVVAWIGALWPKLVTLRWGWRRGWQLAWASCVLRPLMRGERSRRGARRAAIALARTLAVIGVVQTIVVVAVWTRGGAGWESLFGSLVGLAFGGGLVWAVRIIASQALGQEAMGFGDVTLLAMVGALVGWQAALLVFVLAPFAAVLIALAQYLSTGKNAIAFGPYLAASTVGIVVGWYPLWNELAAPRLLLLGSALLAIIGASLVLLALMLWGLRLVRGG